ncbi:MAG TPA: PDZ domain-containing protein, partial [Acidobacteriota bacterium]|nr:PDZ domain-containing protein [Acidobacteriota bacterium]
MKRFVPILICLLAVAATAQENTRLLRFPAIHGDQIVFTYAGDLYTVPAAGGIARPLTSHDGFESFPRFSPDGKHVAFTGQYDGNTEVYLIPAEGGVPQRLTWTATLGRDDVSDRMGPNNIVMGWTPAGREIVFRSRMREFNDFKGQLYLVGLDGDLPRQLPLPRGGFCSYSPDGKQFAYNRVFREFRTWKRYRGGQADDIWVYDFATKQTENITNHPAQDIIPMWHGDRIYFLSDRGANGRMNLYVYERGTRKTRQLTDYDAYDIKFPSLGDTAIVFEYGGWIHRFDLATEQAVQVPIRVATDRAVARGGLTDVQKYINDFDIGPDGKRAVFNARGDIFTVPAKKGAIRNLTRTPGVHDRAAVWSPDGKWIAYISDASGEDEIYIIPQDGDGPAKRLTTGADTYKYGLDWSPDSTRILWSDKKLRLSYVDVETGKVTLVTQAEAWEITQADWAPDSQWIAYAQQEREGMPRVYLYSVAEAKAWPVTDSWYASGGPSFSSDGKFLFFTSTRDFTPTYGFTEFNTVYQNGTRVYFVALAKETESPFKPVSDEVEIKQDKPAKAEGGEKPAEKAADKPADKPTDKKDAAVAVKVDIDGLPGRIMVLPVTPANYYGVNAVGDSVYYVRFGARDERPTLLMYDLKGQKETDLGPVNGYSISADGKKMLVAQNQTYGIIDLPKAKIELKDKLDLADLKVTLDRAAEWRQIYTECWRQMRDFFYAPNMHGVDWAGVEKKYEPLLAHVAHRADLTYIIGEMIGELNCGHTYVGGGDAPAAPRIPMGLLGAELERDSASKAYRITRILKGENWVRSRRSPLTELGVNAQVGDYILAVDGRPVKDMANIYQALAGTAGKQVRLTLNSKPVEEGSREAIVVPVDDELDLYYYNWVQHNIEYVAKATGGQVGYIHIPDMSPQGLNEFVKHFYPQLKKKGLIIDVRGNGGGNVSPMIIERLRRQMYMVDMARNSVPGVDPGAL